jgi:hypothetical protein
MVAESHACPSCGDSVPPGRLSCPHCGSVIAAVARRVDVEPVAAPWPVAPAAKPEPVQVEAAPAATTAAALALAAEVAVNTDLEDEEPTLEPDPEPYKPWPMPAVAEPPMAPTEPAVGTYVPRAPVAPPSSIETVDRPVDLPPAPVFPRVWDPAGAAAGEGVMAATAPASASRLPGITVPRIDRDRVEEAADAMMLVGAFGLVLAFLAPWARVVIGSRGTGYMDTWGLAGSGHVALFVLALGILALAVFQNPIGRWLRTGVLGVTLGSFVLGLAWPYVVGPLGAGPGALLAWVSGLVMLIAGMVSLLVLRHAALPPDV